MSEQVKPVPSKEVFDDLDTMHSIVADASLLISKIRKLPKGRERAVVATKLQEAIFWAKEDIELNHKL